MQKRLVTRYAMQSAEAADENQRRVEGVFAELAETEPETVELHRPPARGWLIRPRVLPRPRRRRREPDCVHRRVRRMSRMATRAGGKAASTADRAARRRVRHDHRLSRRRSSAMISRARRCQYCAGQQPIMWRLDGEAQIQHHDVPRRIRRRPTPEPREPARRGRHGPARLGLRDENLRASARHRKEARSGLDDDHAAAWSGQLRRHHHGAEHVRSGPGNLAGSDWRGWWGDDPPFHTPVFVLTHHPLGAARTGREARPSISSPKVSRQPSSARSRRPTAATWPSAAAPTPCSSTCGPVSWDEFEIHVVPVLLGAGSRLFENLDGGPSGYECTGLASSPAVAHYTYARKPNG